MARLSFSCTWKQNELIVSPDELVENYLFGISLCDQDGHKMSNEQVKFYIQAATEEIEKDLDIKMMPQVIYESLDFFINEWKAWGYVRTSYPINKPFKLHGFIQDIKQIEYPTEWLSYRRTNDGVSQYRNLYIIPGVGQATTNSMVSSGITPHLGFFGNSHIPNYWRVEYCTGFHRVPRDLLDFISKLATLNIFHQLGDIILGAGIASQSIGIDGLSQSISSTSSATNAGYGARITGYLDSMKKSLPRLRAVYKGVTMTSM